MPALVAVALGLLAAGCAGETTRVEVGRSVVVTDENRLSRTHEAPSLLVDRNDSDTVYLAEVELQAGENRFYISSGRGASWKQSEAPKLAPFTDRRCRPRCRPGHVRGRGPDAADGRACAGNGRQGALTAGSGSGFPRGCP